MTVPVPLTLAEQAAAEALGEGLTPAELAVATALADKQNQDELAAGYGAAAMPGDFADEARAVVAAVQPLIAAEIALQLGRDCLQGGLVSFLSRLVGEANADRLLAPILAEALSQSAGRLLDQADRVRQKFPSQPSGWNRTYGLSEAASMLRADAQSLSLPASKETRNG